MKFIGYITNKNYNFSDIRQDYGIPPAYIVKRFNLSNFNKIRIKVAALGIYSLYVNGYLVNDDFMSQDVSEYDKTIYYRFFDITKFVKEGLNSLGIILCDGWYTSYLSNIGRNVFGDYPDKIAFEIYVDDQLAFESDGSEVAHEGAIRAADNQNGIIIDNNYDLGDFSNPHYDISKWNKVNVYEVSAKLKKSIINQTRAFKTFKPKLVKQYDNHHVYDFGQNIAGVVHLIVKGHREDKIVIKHGEVLDDENKLYTANLRKALATDTFILSGKGQEEFLPRHTFHGFRYIDVIIEGDVEILSLEAVAIMTKLSRTGYIKTNNRLVNKFYSNIIWGQRDNFLSIPTDCPQRDERMGWAGDAQIFSETAMFNYDSSKFLKKYICDFCDSMDLYRGYVPYVIPYFHRGRNVFSDNLFEWGHDSPGWSDAIIIIPLNLYLYYGDVKTLKKALPYMKRYMKYTLKNRIKDNNFVGRIIGDWLSVFEETDKNLYACAYLARDNYLISEACRILNDKDQQKYLDEFNKRKKIFRDRFINSDGTLLSDTQGAYILVYSFGLISKEECDKNLVRKVNEFGLLTTGFHSTKYLLSNLCEFGHKDLAYMLLNNKQYPSWGYEISCGATTIWERWDSYRKDIGFNPHGMNSFNHYSLGSVGEWMYKSMVGICPVYNNPAFKTIHVSPYFDKSVSNLKASLKTKCGTVIVQYKIINNSIHYYIKGGPKNEFVFDFHNRVISRKEISKNEFEFELEY